MLCDDVFGEENFVSSMIWSAGRKNDSKFISNSHEYMLCYLEVWNICILKKKSGEQLKKD